MHRKQEVTEKQGVCRAVGDGEVIVGMRSSLRLQDQGAATEVERQLVIDSKGREDDLDAFEGVGSSIRLLVSR
jgi:hypothetical protein